MKNVSERDSTKEQLIDELVKLRRRVAELEALEFEHKHTEAELVQRNQQLLTVQAAVAAISSSLELEAVLGTVAGEMIKLLKVTGCVIYEWNSVVNTITIIFEVGPPAWEHDSHMSCTFPLADFPLTKQVLVERTPQQMAINQPDIEPSELAYMQECHFKTLLMLPMIFQERVIGLLEIVDEQTSRAFKDQEITLAQLLANQAASAIENAQFYAAEKGPAGGRNITGGQSSASPVA